jgi:ribosomal-protein-alanine N-acetyltransferase
LFIFDRHAPSVTCLGNVSLGCILRNAAHFCFLGYGSAASYEGRGYMTEAVGAVVDYGFQQLNLHRIQANYMPSNERSGRLLKRLGFEIEGYARDYLCLNGVWQDHVMTAKLNPDWRSPAQV